VIAYLIFVATIRKKDILLTIDYPKKYLEPLLYDAEIHTDNFTYITTGASTYGVEYSDYGDYNKIPSVSLEYRKSGETLPVHAYLIGGLAATGMAVSKMIEYACKDGNCTTSGTSTSLATGKDCKNGASLYIDVSGELEGEPRFEVKPPSGVTFKGGGGFIFSNTKSDSGSIYGDCISGDYDFTYSYTSGNERKVFSGTITIDGHFSNYNITIHHGGLFEGPKIVVSGY
jgi:hypothetical protein